LTVQVVTQAGIPPSVAIVHVEQADPAIAPLAWEWVAGDGPDETTGIVAFPGLRLGWPTRLNIDTFFPAVITEGGVIITGTQGKTLTGAEGTSFVMPATMTLTVDVGAPTLATVAASAATAKGKKVPVGFFTETGRPLVPGWDALTPLGEVFALNPGNFLVGTAAWDGYSLIAASFHGSGGSTVASMAKAVPVQVVGGHLVSVPPLRAGACASVKGVVKGVKKGRKYQVYVENRATTGSYTRQAFPKPKKATSSRLAFTVPGVAVGRYSVRVQDETKPGGTAAFWKDSSSNHSKLPLVVKRCAVKKGVNLTLKRTSKAVVKTQAEIAARGSITLTAKVAGVRKPTGLFKVTFGPWSTTKRMTARNSGSLRVKIPKARTCGDTAIVRFTPSGATAKLASPSIQRLRVECHTS